MIKDKLENAEQYYIISENLKKGFEWLKNNDLKSIDNGKHIIDGDKIFANVQTYETKDTAPFETHRKYIDIQYMIDGEEEIGITHYTNCETTQKYDEEKDLEFLDVKTNRDFNILYQDEFMVFFPNDAHQPALKINTNKTVKKVIVKVAI